MYAGAGVPEGPGSGAATPPELTPAVEILRKQQAERGMDLEAIFNTSGVPVMLHKYRKALLGSVGACPPLPPLVEADWACVCALGVCPADDKPTPA